MALFCLYLSLLLHLPDVPLDNVGVELDGNLTDRDEVKVPAAQDGESYGHAKTHEPLKTEQQAFAVGRCWVARHQRHTTALCDVSVCVYDIVCMQLLQVCILISLAMGYANIMFQKCLPFQKYQSDHSRMPA